MTNYREIMRLNSLGVSHVKIAQSMGIARQTVVTTLQRACVIGLDWEAARSLSDSELSERLYPADASKRTYSKPDCELIHREMAKPGVTLQLLWYEYFMRCREAGETPYQLTQFKKRYHDFALQTNATMHIGHKPGELTEVDWAGTTAEIVDRDTGEVSKAYIFVAVLAYSGYTYIEAFADMKTDSWITGHVNAFAYFGGVTRILVPDNLKTGVIKHPKNDDVVLNKAYQELAEHYGIAVLPTRIKAPKDKPSVEGMVGIATTNILAAIRNMRFFTVQELNTEIKERLRALNHKPFQKKPESRLGLFIQEKQYLLPLPKYPFELAEWKIATVAFNYHICVDGQYYSVPFDYIKKKVNVRLAKYTLEVYHDGVRISSHARLHGYHGQYSTSADHMPPKHKQYSEWNGGRFRGWAAQIGPKTAVVIESILTRYKIEQQGYNSCRSLLKLADQYTPQRLEAVCAMMLQLAPMPTFRLIQSALKSGRDQVKKASANDAGQAPDGTFIRGPEYYRKGR